MCRTHLRCSINTAALTRLVVLVGALSFTQDALSQAGTPPCVPLDGDDLDNDGFSDSCELQIAQDFSPQFVFHGDDMGTQAHPHWLVHPQAESGRVTVFYALSYLNDHGLPVFGSDHFGDTEFVALDLRYSDGDWQIERAFMSAHYRSLNEQSDWYDGETLEYFEGHPLVYVARDKHGNFPSYEACDEHWFEYCEELPIIDTIDISADRNLGSPHTPLVNEVWLNAEGNVCTPGSSGCNVEYYWSDIPFCGWQVEEGVDRSEAGCVHPQNSYARQLVALLDRDPTNHCEAYIACCSFLGANCNPNALRRAQLYRQWGYNASRQNQCRLYLRSPTFQCNIAPPPPPSNTGTSDGDPHYRTFDAVKYDMQGVGEFTLALDTADGFEVQTRTAPWGSSSRVSVNTAVAARVGADRVGFYIDGTARLNGETVEFLDGFNELPDGGEVYRTGGRYVIVWPDNSQLHVIRSSSFMGARVYLPDDRRDGGVVGLLGNFDGVGQGDLITRDGTVLESRPAFEYFYGTYAESWRVTQDTSLFDYAPGETTETFTDRSFPSSLATTADLTAEEYESAEGVCEAASVPEDWMEDCILDVGFTGDPSFADGLADAPPVEMTVEIEPPEDACPPFPSAGSLCVGPGTACSEHEYSCNGTFPDCDCDSDPLPPPEPVPCTQHADCPGGICYAHNAACGEQGTCSPGHVCVDPGQGVDTTVCGCNGVTYSTGCEALAAGNIAYALGECPPLDLLQWVQEGTPGNGNWQVAADGLSVLQTVNGNPTFFVSPNDFINTTIEGSFRVETTSDDDYIGFVLGYQSPLASQGDAVSDYDFVLFDWKKADQTLSGAAGLEGFTLSRVRGSFADPTAALWGHAVDGVEVLATDYGSDRGWTANEDHVFKVDYANDNIRIVIDDELIFDVDGEFPTGRLGFYNLSQERVRYRNFTAAGSQ